MPISQDDSTRRNAFAITATIAAAMLVFNLFWLGAKPIAVGLFPPPTDKIAHGITFGLLAALLWFGVAQRRAVCVVLSCALVGALDEWHQVYLPGRSSDINDWLFDVGAAMVAVYLLPRFFQKIGKVEADNKPR